MAVSANTFFRIWENCECRGLKKYITHGFHKKRAIVTSTEAAEPRYNHRRWPLKVGGNELVCHQFTTPTLSTQRNVIKSYKFHFTISACNLACHKCGPYRLRLATAVPYSLGNRNSELRIQSSELRTRNPMFTLPCCMAAIVLTLPFLLFAAPWPTASSPTTRIWCSCSTWPSCSYVNLWKAIASYKSCQWICPAIMVSLIQRQRTIRDPVPTESMFQLSPFRFRVIAILLSPANVKVREGLCFWVP